MTVSELFEWVEAEPSIARYSSAARKLASVDDRKLPEIRIALLRNITLEGIVPYLQVKCHQAGVRPTIHLGQFDNVQQESFDTDGALAKFQADVIVVALRLHTFVPDLVYRFFELSESEVVRQSNEARDRLVAIARQLRERSGALLVFHGFEIDGPNLDDLSDRKSRRSQRDVIRDLNRHAAQALSEIDNVRILDLDRVLAKVGYDSAYDHRYWHMARSPYAASALKAISSEYVRFVRVLKGRSKKCVVLDCDNTLWGGVIAEEGLNGIHLGSQHPGSAFQELQRAVLDLYHRGILLALCSKNNLADVQEVLNDHPGSLLKPHHFVVSKVNWEDKVSNLREIARELNIGLDSLVFVDDNPFEREYVRKTLPEVTVVDLSAIPTEYRRILQSLDLFDSLSFGDEDKRRNQMYAAQSAREAAKKDVGSLDDYLKSLEMLLTIRVAREQDKARIAQLTQKTNQFNLTTRRYSDGEIARMMADPSCHVYCAELQDRFDSSGTIAVIIVRDQQARALIDTFLMSCRVIGRGVETALMARIVRDARHRGLAVAGEYLPTAKNVLVADFLPNAGFVKAADGSWLLDPSIKPVEPAWFKEIKFDLGSVDEAKAR